MKKLFFLSLISTGLLATSSDHLREGSDGRILESASSIDRVRPLSYAEVVLKNKRIAEQAEAMTLEQKEEAALRAFFYHIKNNDDEYVESFFSVFGSKYNHFLRSPHLSEAKKNRLKCAFALCKIRETETKIIEMNILFESIQALSVVDVVDWLFLYGKKYGLNFCNSLGQTPLGALKLSGHSREQHDIYLILSQFIKENRKPSYIDPHK